MAVIERHRAHFASGVRLEYAECGTGPAIVFLHGYSDSWYSFDQVMRRMPGNVRALALTPRGDGDSDRPESGYRIEDFAADVVAFMEAARLASVALVGHSMGSLVAQEVALAVPIACRTSSSSARLPPLATRSCASSRRPYGSFATPSLASSHTGSRPAPCTARSPRRSSPPSLNESLKMPARVWRDALAGILGYRADTRLASLSMPTLIVWGDRDQISSRPEQDRLRETIRGSTLAIYEATGHSPHWEQPQRFVDDLMAFVEPDLTPP